ncbi:cytochrome c family protein [uncultured Algimonas sp.]|uniref:c-type cytochrome n=1 Tax=uncultured Algimonas sp. TaxID=1547920 RepID=UPI002601C1A5|nr:cytochrome c family protein [uncultured Algimonas sp.]
MPRHAFTVISAIFLTACGGGDDGGAADPHTTIPPAVTDMTNLERGAILYKRCRACHTLGQGERHKVGPNLWGIYGRTAGTREDFNYSNAMAGSEIVWSDETLSAYIENPRDYIPGNRMSFAGLRKEADRDALLEYLRAETGG